MYAYKRSTIFECSLADALDAVLQNYACDGGVSFERIVADRLYGQTLVLGRVFNLYGIIIILTIFKAILGVKTPPVPLGYRGRNTIYCVWI